MTSNQQGEHRRMRMLPKRTHLWRTSRQGQRSRESIIMIRKYPRECFCIRRPSFFSSLIRETFFGRILTVLKTSQWYLHLLCAIFVRTLCQLLLFTTESTKAYDRNETTARHLRDRISINNSAEENHSSMSTKKTYQTVPDHPSSREEYTRHRLPKSNSHHAR